MLSSSLARGASLALHVRSAVICLLIVAMSKQVSMESNGKGVAIDGTRLPFESGEVDFGEPGTNGQHSFYQLIHQGRVIPCEFIGILKSQQSVYLKVRTPVNLALATLVGCP